MVNLTYRHSTTAPVPTENTAKGAPLTNAEIDGNHRAIAEAISRIEDESIKMAIVLG